MALDLIRFPTDLASRGPGLTIPGEVLDKLALISRPPPDDAATYTRDALYGWTAERLTAKQTDIGVPAYLYYFDHGYPAADQGGYRAFHASEIPLSPNLARFLPVDYPDSRQGTQVRGILENKPHH